MIVYKYRIYPDESDPMLRQILMRGERFARVMTEIHQRYKEAAADRKLVAVEQRRDFALLAKSRFLAEARDARAHSGLHGSTCSAISAARDQAARTTSRKCLLAKKGGVCRCGEEHAEGTRIWMQFEPRVAIVGCPFCGRGLRMPISGEGGVIGGQIRHDRRYCTTDEILGGESSAVRITGTGRDRVVHRRVAAADGEPVWLSAPMVYHRPLPPGEGARDARFVRRRIGHHAEWHVLLTIDSESSRLPSPTKGSVGIDLGWRQMDTGELRVAAWRDDTGAEGEVRIPAQLVRDMRSVDELQSTRSTNLDALRDALVLARESWPAGLSEATRSLHQWRSPDRFVRLMYRIRREAPGVAGAGALRDWYRRLDDTGLAHGESHLREWAEHQREHCLLRRKEFFRLQARQFAAYREMHCEDLDLSKLARLADDPEERLARKARHNRMLAAPSYLRADILSCVERAGGLVVKVDPAYTTQKCPMCGLVSRLDPMPIIHTCPECGVTLDQDLKAAENIRRAPRCSPPKGPRSQPQDAEVAKLSAWARRKAAKTAREAEDRSQGDLQVVDNIDIAK